MRELLLEQLKEYQDQYEAIKAECIEMMKLGKESEPEFLDKAKKAAGLRQLRDAAILELNKYV
jgi:hypothetical protein